ncbi:hypothetical protein [Solibacillus sp. FSL K6-4121]|uniref:hypothetical protein n=1 Tax=Solibacillus sp. FSL K6-4121 TaxID=2921505 RepID=UPI0030F65402
MIDVKEEIRKRVDVLKQYCQQAKANDEKSYPTQCLGAISRIVTKIIQNHFLFL